MEPLVETVTFTHQFLWRVGKLNLESAQAEPAHRKYLLTSSFLVSFLAFEAFIHYLGEIVRPEIWAQERQYFRKPPYQGLDGKFRFLSESLSVVLLPDDPDYIKFLRAKHCRDLIAHGKPMRLEFPYDPEDSIIAKGDYMKLAWDEIFVESEIENIRHSLQILAERLRAPSYEKHSEDELHLIFPAFNGCVATASNHFGLIK